MAEGFYQGVGPLPTRMAQENAGWGYDRISGALANLGYRISDQTIGNKAARHRARSEANTKHHLRDLISAHMTVIAGTDFFSVEVLTWRGLATY